MDQVPVHNISLQAYNIIIIGTQSRFLTVLAYYNVP